MKHAKKLLALLLTIALALSLALPAFAEEEPNPAMPVITVQPQGGSQKAFRASFTVSVQAHIPNDDNIGYEWYRNGVLTRQTGASMNDGLSSPGTLEIYVVVYNRDNPEYRVTSQTVQCVLEELSFLEKVHLEVNGLFKPTGFLAEIFWTIISIPLALLTLPLSLIGAPLLITSPIWMGLLAPIMIPIEWIVSLFR